MSRPPVLLPNAEYLRECFDYDPKTGVLMWRERPQEHFKTKARWVSWNKRYPGKPAGSIDAGGYLKVVIGGAQRRIHRVVMKWMTGEDPRGEVDHIDRRIPPNQSRRSDADDQRRRRENPWMRTVSRRP